MPPRARTSSQAARTSAMVSTMITRHRPARGATRDRRGRESRRACSASARYAGLLVVVKHFEMAAHGVDVATRDRARSSAASAPRVSTFSSVARTSGSNAAGGTPAASASRAACPSSATRWLDATVAAAWYATAVGIVHPERAHAERDREPLDVGGAVDRAPRARAAGQRRSRATAATATDGAIRPRRRAARARSLCSSSSVHTPEQVDHECAGAQARRDRGRGIGDRGVGGGDQHEVGAGGRRGRCRVRARRAAPRRGAPTASRARGRRPRSASTHGRPSRAASVVPARPGPTRANARCV